MSTLKVTNIQNGAASSPGITLNSDGSVSVPDLDIDTDAVAEGSENLYYTDGRASSAAPVQSVNTATGAVVLGTDDIAEGSSNLYYTDARVDAVIAASDTDDLGEGLVNLYYTDARAIAAAPVQSVNTQTGEVSLGAADVGALPSDANLGDLSDVDVAGAAAGDVLAYDGADWVPDSDTVRSEEIGTIKRLDQSEYDLLTPDADTMYIII